MVTTRTTETQGNHDLYDAFSNPGCPLCALIAQAVSRYMRSTNYDAIADPDIRRQFEASLGFCNRHAHQWLAEAFVLGTAQMYRDLLRLSAEALRKPARKGGGIFGRGAASHGLPVAKAPCPACEIQAETEARLIATLTKGLADPAFREAWEASEGLCLPHLRNALAVARPEAAEALRARALATHETLLAQLDETIRKHDYRFRHEPAGPEAGSPARAVTLVAGALGVTGRDDR
jgi:hypothetical protein